MAPLIGHDNKTRTVTFGNGSGDGPTEGAYRTARMYSRLGIAVFGVPATILTAIAIWLLVDFASDLAATWSVASAGNCRCLIPAQLGQQRGY